MKTHKNILAATATTILIILIHSGSHHNTFSTSNPWIEERATVVLPHSVKENKTQDITKAIIWGGVALLGISLLVGKIKAMKTQQKYTVLRTELNNLLMGNSECAERLINHEKKRNPGNPEEWYLDKLIYDLKQGR